MIGEHKFLNDILYHNVTYSIFIHRDFRKALKSKVTDLTSWRMKICSLRSNNAVVSIIQQVSTIQD